MTTSPLASPSGADLALAAASAGAAVLPSVEPLVAAGAQPGNEHVTAAFAGAAIAELEGARPGRIAVLVGSELTDALTTLEPGAVLRLNHPSSAPLDVTVDDVTFAHATAGAQGQRLAALIVGTRKENR